MIAFSSGPTATEDWRNSFRREEPPHGSGWKRTVHTSENIDDAEELVLSQENAPGTRRTVRYFEHKKWQYCESDFLVLETSVFDTSF